MASFLQISTPKPYMHFYSALCVPHLTLTDLLTPLSSSSNILQCSVSSFLLDQISFSVPLIWEVQLYTNTHSSRQNYSSLGFNICVFELQIGSHSLNELYS